MATRARAGTPTRTATAADAIENYDRRAKAMTAALRRMLSSQHEFIGKIIASIDAGERVHGSYGLATTAVQADTLAREIDDLYSARSVLAGLMAALPVNPTAMIDALSLVLALHDDPGAGVPGYLVKLDPMAEAQLRAALKSALAAHSGEEAAR